MFRRRSQEIEISAIWLPPHEVTEMYCCMSWSLVKLLTLLVYPKFSGPWGGSILGWFLPEQELFRSNKVRQLIFDIKYVGHLGYNHVRAVTGYLRVSVNNLSTGLIMI